MIKLEKKFLYEIINEVTHGNYHEISVDRQRDRCFLIIISAKWNLVSSQEFKMVNTYKTAIIS